MKIFQRKHVPDRKEIIMMKYWLLLIFMFIETITAHCFANSKIDIDKAINSYLNKGHPTPQSSTPIPTLVLNSGSGCEYKHKNKELDFKEQQIISIPLKSLKAISGKSISLKEKRKYCQYSIDLATPKGWSYAVDKILLSTEHSVEEGVTALAKVTAYFQGEDKSTYVLNKFKNNSNKLKTIIKDTTDKIFSSCQDKRYLQVKGEVRIKGVKKEGKINLKGPLLVFLKWKRCK